MVTSTQVNGTVKRAGERIRQMLALLVVLAIAALPLVIGFVAGVVYGVARIVWAALVEGFMTGSGLVRR